MYIIKVRPVWAKKDADCLYIRSYRTDRWGRVLWLLIVKSGAKTFPTRAAAKAVIASLYHRKRDADFKPTFTIVPV